MYFIIFSIIFCLLLPIFQYIYHQFTVFCCGCRLPGPKQIPFLGHGLQIFKKKKFYNFLLNLCPKYSPLFKIWSFNTLIVVVTDPKKCKMVLHSCVTKPEEIKILSSAIGDGLFALTGFKWGQRRKLLKKPFSSLSIFNNYFDIFRKSSQNFILTLAENVNKEVDVYSLLRLNNSGLVIESCLGFKLDLGAKKILTNNFTKLEKLVEKRMSNPFLHSDWLWRLTLNYRKTRFLYDDMRDFVKIVINSYKNTEIKKNNLLDYLLDLVNEGKLTKTEVIDELQSIIASEANTTNIIIAATIIMLAIHQKIQNKLRKEIFEVIGSKDQELTNGNLTKMIYLQCVIKETLRLFPPGAVIVRKNTQKITIDNFVIPNDTIIIIPIEHLHRDPKFWTDPLSFRPERFLPENLKKLEKTSFLPFGHTPRNCLGDIFAMTVIQIFLCDILRNFEITESQYASMEEIEMKWASSVRAMKHGYTINLKYL